jgi:uncharacterized protein YrzB (UPF0473 family)
MIVVNEDGQETEVDILLTFDSPDGKRKFVLISDPQDPDENVYAFLYNDEGGMEEVTDPDDFAMCQEVLSAFIDEEDADEA